MRVLLTALVVVGLAACGSLPTTDTEDTLVGRVPDLAAEADGKLYVRYAGSGKPIVLIAQWPPDEAGAPAVRYRAARLEVEPTPVDVESMARTGRRVMLLPESEWNSLLTQLLTGLAPAAPGEAALAVVQGEDIVFARDGSGLKIYRHEQKPAALRVTQPVTEEEFSRRVSELLAERYGRDAVVLFDTGRSKAGRALIFVDVARGDSVLITPSSAPAALGGPPDLGLALSMTDAVVIRSHLITPLTQPVTSVTRLTWLTLQTATGLLPHPRVPAGAARPLTEQGAAMNLAQFERELDEQFGSRRTEARLTPLIDGDAYFTRLVQGIQEARESVRLRLYIFDTDPYSLRLADLLKERSKTIRVQVLLDQLGTLAAGRMPGKLPYPGATHRDAPSSIVEYLQSDSNVRVRTVANPWLTSDHTKTIHIDNARVFIGGMNIGQEYRYEWHDLMVEVEGPVATQLARDFDLAWSQATIGGDLARVAHALEPALEAAPIPAGAVEMRALYTRTGAPEILLAQLAAIRRAQSYIYVEQPYMSDDEIIAALVDARRRGVDVRVVLPTAGDSGFMNAANLIATNVFVRNGVRVYAFPGMTHVKAAIYDGWACVGSANFDKLSLRINRETNIATSDPGFVGALRRDLFERDFARSREITEARPVGWSTYLSSFIANQL